MNILDQYLELKEPCWKFPCHLCSNTHKLFIESLIEKSYLELTNQEKNFYEITGIAPNSYQVVEVNRERLGKYIGNLLLNINFNDNYTLQRIGFKNQLFENEKFVLFLYLTFAIAEDTETTIHLNLVHRFKLKGFKIENILSKWCSQYMTSNQTAVFKCIKCFFEYGSEHYIKLNPKTRARFLERAIHNSTALELQSLDILSPLNNDLEGIKELYQRKVRE